jgi:hypothetical protein
MNFSFNLRYFQAMEIFKWLFAGPAKGLNTLEITEVSVAWRACASKYCRLELALAWR